VPGALPDCSEATETVVTLLLYRELVQVARKILAQTIPPLFQVCLNRLLGQRWTLRYRKAVHNVLILGVLSVLQCVQYVTIIALRSLHHRLNGSLDSRSRLSNIIVSRAEGLD
jgi:hypothetical protein